ncbi:MAG: site-specific integrase [Candidatus Heimdallarchaeota archaeon]
MTHKLIEKYLVTIKESLRAGRKSNIKKYLEWRDVLVEELISSGLNEKIYFEQFLKDPQLKYKSKSRQVVLATIRKFLIFHNVPLKMSEQKKAVWYFDDDPAMKDFIEVTGRAPGTKKNANSFLAHYANFRGKTPTELLQEVKELSIPELRVILTKYYNSMKIKSAKNRVQHVVRFYYYLANIRVDLPAAIKSRSTKKLMLGEKLIDKTIIKQMLEAADLRDSMIILACFESGLNPCDLVNINYGHLKKHLNLEDPNAINKAAVIVHTRQKTGYEFLACFGPQTLRFMSKWLKLQKEELNKWSQEITDESAIFSMKKAPFQGISVSNITKVLKKISRRAGLEETYSSADFRNSFNTRAKQLLKHYDKELFMGHVGGIERHYDNSTLEYYTNEYQRAWEMLFDLSYDNEKVSSLEEKYYELKEAYKDQSFLIENFYNALFDPESSTKTNRKELEKTISRIIEMRKKIGR